MYNDKWLQKRKQAIKKTKQIWRDRSQGKPNFELCPLCLFAESIVESLPKLNEIGSCEFCPVFQIYGDVCSEKNNGWSHWWHTRNNEEKRKGIAKNILICVELLE